MEDEVRDCDIKSAITLVTYEGSLAPLDEKTKIVMETNTQEVLDSSNIYY